MFERLFKYPIDEFRRSILDFRPELALLLLAAALAAAIIFYRRAPGNLTGRRRALLAGLRGLALGLLLVILLHPVLLKANYVNRNAYVAVLVDDSRSMTIPDGQADDKADPKNRLTRLAVAKQLLFTSGSHSGLLEQLDAVCPVKLLKFGPEVQAVAAPDDLTGAGEQTNLYSALRAYDSELRGLPIAAVVVLTDGSATTGLPPEEITPSLRQKNIPVYAVGLGAEKPPRDLEVMSVQAPRQINRNSQVDIYVNVRSTGYTQPFDVVLHQGDKTVETVKVNPPAAQPPSAGSSGGDVQRIRMRIQPDEKGTLHYTVEIPPAPDELITSNNAAEFLVQVKDRRLPVLYLEGSPREEYRFIRRALHKDQDFRIASIVRLAPSDGGGPKKFLVQGAEPEDNLQDGFPKTAKDLSRFEAVILGDIEADYLSKEQLALIKDFVYERGGGFLMLGGVNSFNLGHYQGTPIEEMLPVVLPDASVDYQNREFSMVLTPEGEKHVTMHQNSNPLVNRRIWSTAPTLIGYNPITQVKPAAQVLAVEPKTKMPLLVVQQYGLGRSGALATGGSWHWRMALPMGEELHEKFWRQTVRWLAMGAKPKLSVRLSKDLLARREQLMIYSTLLDKEYRPENEAELKVVIKTPFGNTVEIPQERLGSEDGVYQCQYEPMDPGNYEVTVTAATKDDKGKVEQVVEEATFSVGDTLEEYKDPGQKVALLKDLAEKTGGLYLTSDQAGKIAPDIARRISQMTSQSKTYQPFDIWDMPILLGLLVTLLCVEWFVRRRSGLM